MNADHGNELLTHLLKNPFDDYEEIADQSLFQFSGSEIDLDMDLDTFDDMEYDDTVRLVDKNNLMKIEGYVAGRKRYDLDLHGIVSIQNSDMRVKSDISFAKRDMFYTPMELLMAINTSNSNIFSVIHGSFAAILPTVISSMWSGQFPFAYHNYGRHIISIYTNRNLYNELKIVIKIEVPSYYEEGAWVIETSKIFYWTKSTRAVSITTTVSENDWIYLTSKTNNFKQNYVDYIGKSFVPDLLKVSRNYTAFDIIDWNGDIIFFGLYDWLYVEFVSFKNFNTNLSYLSPELATQPFSNVISDLCFMYNAWFCVKNFDELHINPVNTGIQVLDIKPWRHYISSQEGQFSQEVKAYDYNDYRFKSINAAGENAFGFSDEYAALLNENYKYSLVGVLETIFRIYRVRDQSGITDLPVIEKNYQIKYGNMDLGLVKKIGYDNDGQEYILTCRKYLDDLRFSDWWNL